MWFYENIEWTFSSLIVIIGLVGGGYKIKQLDAKLKAVEVDRAKVDVDKAELEVDSLKIDNLKEIIDTYREELTSLKSYFDKRVNEVLDYSEELKVTNNIQSEVIREHSFTIEKLIIEVKKAKENLASLLLENEKLIIEVDKLTNYNNELLTEIEYLKDYIQKLEKANEKLTK